MNMLGAQGNPCATSPSVVFLMQLLLLCSSLVFCTGSAQSDPTTCPGSSVAIPHPFSISDNSTPGFAISCLSTGPMLSLGDKLYAVLDISLHQGYVRVAGDTVYSLCQQQNNGRVAMNFLDLEGTPFTFSHTLNKFTVVGCDSMAMIRTRDFDAGKDMMSQYVYRGGCVSFCATEGSITSGACSGVGCCQASVPEELKVLDLELTSIRSQLLQQSSGSLGNVSRDNSSSWCTKAFIADQGSYVFSRDDLDRNLTNLPMVLDWSISGGNCLEARSAPRTYMCRENTDCITVANNTGYRCNCSEGFDGNPYLQGTDGCQDIDECKDERMMNPCTHKCINKVGRFDCICPMGMTGDGKKQGTGCKRDTKLLIATGGALPLLLVLLVLGFWTHWLVKKRKLAKTRQRYFLQNGGMLLKQQMFSQRAPLRIFTSGELEKATDRFSDDNIVGRGGFGTVYRGILLDHMVVAIKKAQQVDQSQVEQFVNEMLILSQVNHKNVVQLIGCCLESEVPLLVYEFITNGALYHHLHNTSVPMPWKLRLRIAVETATALAYLHLTTKTPIIHRDVKSSNILLDESFAAKVSDFGASRPMPHNKTHVTTLVQGTLGYMDPEYFQTSQLTERSDVYSFGVVLLELLTRQKPIFGSKTDEVRSLALHFDILFHQNRLMEIVDHQVADESGARHVKSVAQLALRCLRLKGEERPRMIEVAVELEALRRLMKQHLVC